jgi:hypothetical protein
MEGQMIDVARVPKGEILPGFMTASEVAEHFGVTPHCIRMWVKRGLLKHCKEINGLHFYKEQDVATLEPPKERRKRLLAKALAMIASGEIQ